jgi:hypothetical protein
LNDASNNYHALQTKFDKRFSHGVQFQANYTWAKGLNFDPDYYTNDPFLNHGLDDFNRKHVLALTGLFELPFGRGKRFANTESGVLDRLVGGWQLNTVTRVTSGPPFSPTYKDCGADRDTGPCRPNLVGSVDILGDRDKWFTTAGVLELANLQTAGPWQRPAKGTFGSAGRNSIFGPSFFNTDMSLFKNILITERVRTQFRVEAFNVFNHVQLGTPNNCIDCNLAQDGRITSLLSGASMRQLQFGLRVQF